MADTLEVLIEERVAGTLTRLPGGDLRFEYDSGYRALSEATPLSTTMPRVIPSHGDGVITPWLWGLLPDSEAVLARWARAFQVSLASPFGLLSSPVGEDCAGAVRFTRADPDGGSTERAGSVDWLTEDEVADRLRDLRRDSTAWLGAAMTGRFSLAGAQAKTALLFQDGLWGVPSGSTPTTHILKPAIAGFDEHDLNEHLCLDAARRAGLLAARTRVARFADQTAIVVERYDRRMTPEGMTRVHQEDLCQALGLHPARKYQADGGPGPPAVADLFRRVMPPSVADDAVGRFADALIWNWVIAGTDAHAKNYSLLLAGGAVRMAPLYDVASALPYRESEHALRFAMKLGRDYKVTAHRNPWPGVARDLGLRERDLIERARHLSQTAPDAFSAAAAAPDVAALGSGLPARMVDLVAARAARCTRVLDTA